MNLPAALNNRKPCFRMHPEPERPAIHAQARHPPAQRDRPVHCAPGVGMAARLVFDRAARRAPGTG
jgi:hypothetical protein